MNNIYKRSISLLIVFSVAITMCFGGLGYLTSYGAETEGRSAEKIALTVYNGDVKVKEYTLDDLNAIAATEGNKEYKYSGYNRHPSFYTFGDENARPDVQKCVGPTVSGILADAGVEASGKQLVKFVGSDGVAESFTAENLFMDRYYYPNAKGLNDGRAAEEQHYANAEKAVPILDLYRNNEMESVLRFGQMAPNDQNVACFLKYVADGGKIIVGAAVTEKWPEVAKADYNSGTILPETVVGFDVSALNGKKVAAYYTVDGSEPTYGDAIYNFNKYGDINSPEIDKEGTYTIKFKVIGPGKLDSETTTFNYKIEDVASPDVPANFVANPSGDDSIDLSWNPVSNADKYEVMRLNASGIYDVIGTTAECSYVDSLLTTGTEYKYKVRAFKQLDSGQKVYGNGTDVKSAIPYLETPEGPSPDVPKPDSPVQELATPTLKSVARKSYNSINIRWTEVVNASGYEIYRYDKVSKKYSLVKTVSDDKTVSYINGKLKTGRKYTYKVRAYLTLEDGTVKFGSYSSKKAATPYLTKPTVSLKAGSKSVTVKWKKVSGANGYKIYRATSKKGKYKVVKTIKKGSKVSWKNTKLKKGKKYYYKVKAYRTVDKKKVYSSYSSIKYTKAK